MAPKNPWKQDEEHRELNPETEVGLRANQPNPTIKLLADYEGVIGMPLQYLEVPTILKETGGPWFWSWTPRQAGYFLSAWESTIYLVNPLLRNLACTELPGGGGMMYEKFCRKDVKEAIDKVEVIYDLPIGIIPPIPRGTFDIDLTVHPPYTRPTIFTINHWHFSGKVKGISQELRDELAYRHGMWYESQARIHQPLDHGIVELPAVRR